MQSSTDYASQINVLQQMQKLYKTPKVPFATVVTDLTRCHATWFHRVTNAGYSLAELVTMLTRRG